MSAVPGDGHGFRDQGAVLDWIGEQDLACAAILALGDEHALGEEDFGLAFEALLHSIEQGDAGFRQRRIAPQPRDGGIGADDRDALVGAGRQRQRAVILEQHDGLARGLPARERGPRHWRSAWRRLLHPPPAPASNSPARNFRRSICAQSLVDQRQRHAPGAHFVRPECDRPRHRAGRNRRRLRAPAGMPRPYWRRHGGKY